MTEQLTPLGHGASLIDLLMQYEDGTLDNRQTIALFQELIDSGWAWQIGGEHARVAREFLLSGECLPYPRPASRVYVAKGIPQHTLEQVPVLTLNSNTLESWLADYNDGVLLTSEVYTLFQYLIDNSIVWGMGQDMRDTAEELIRDGHCKRND